MSCHKDLIRFRSKYNACFETNQRVQSAGLMGCLSFLSMAHWDTLALLVVVKAYACDRRHYLNIEQTLYLYSLFSDDV